MKTANRVAFNTFVQYVQLVLNIVIGLVSVRLILAALGKVDYGVYDVIGGVVSLLAFVSSSLSQSSGRFISVSLGKHSVKDTQAVFRACFFLHFVIATFLAIVIEFAGMYILDGFLVIPSDRLGAAKIIYHCAVITLFLNITFSPYYAVINSFEDFWYTSLVGFLNSVSKLVIAILVTYFYSDKLIAYGVLLVCVTIIDKILIAGYAYFRYKEYMSVSYPKMRQVKEVASFVGWTMLDVLSVAFSRQGYAIMLNKFFGPIMNTTFSLARQLEGQVYTISSSAVFTMKPQVMKSQGEGNSKRMFRLSMTAGKFGFALTSLVGIPLIVMMPEVLTLWLGSYPEDTITFARILITSCVITELTRGLTFANQAVGNIKMFSIAVSSFRLLALPLSWMALYFGASAFMAIFIFLVCETAGALCRIFILAKISDFQPIWFVKQVVAMMFPPALIALIVCIFFSHFLCGLIGLLFNALITVVIYAFLIYKFGLTKEELSSLQIVWKSICSKVHRKN